MSACSKCGIAFFCGSAEGSDHSCWCTRLPALPADALDPSAGCLCPTCLQERIEQLRQTAPQAPA